MCFLQIYHTDQEVSTYDVYCYCWDMNNNNVAATSDSEELSGAEEIRCVCDVMVGLVSISAVPDLLKDK